MYTYIKGSFPILAKEIKTQAPTGISELLSKYYEYVDNCLLLRTPKWVDVWISRYTNYPEINKELENTYGCLDCLRSNILPEDLEDYSLKYPQVFTKELANGFFLNLSYIEETWTCQIDDAQHISIGGLDIFNIDTLRNLESFIINNY